MIARVVEACGELCLTYRKTVLLVLLAITALNAVQLPRATFDNAMDMWFLDDDPALLAHRRLIDTFSSDEIIVIGLEAPDVFAPDVLERIHRISSAAEQAPHVEKVFSLTSIESVTGNDGVLEIGDLVEMPLDPSILPATRERALANEMYLGNVLSADGRFTCIVIRLPHYADQFDYKIESVEAIRAIAERETDGNYYLSGGPVMDEQFLRMSERDGNVTISLMMLLLVGVLWLLLRSVQGVLLPLATVALAMVWALGWMVLAGVRINVITTMLPPLLLAVGVADSMHVLVEYQNRLRHGMEKMTALRAVYAELLVPLFLTSLTTSIGMLSLGISRVQGVREFGLFAALGVNGAFLLSITFVPIMLSYLPAPRVTASRHQVISTRALEALHVFTMRRGRAIFAVSMVLLALGAAGATRVRTESAWLEIFKDSARVKIDTIHIRDALAGTVTLDVVVDTGGADGIKDPAVIRELDELQTFLRSHELVASSQSMSGYFKDMRRAFFDNDQREYQLPASREEAAQYLLMYEMDAPDGDMKDFVTFDYRETRISSRMSMTSSNEASALIAATERYIAEEFPDGVTGTVSGLAQLYTNMEEYIRSSLLRGFSAAMVAIFIVFCVQMRSIRLGAIAMIPNVTPLLMCLGVMGLMGINLDSMTCMVASIAIGLAVDDSIHFVTRVRSRLEQGSEMVDALREATVEVGRALIYTTLSLCAGFGVMMFGSFVGMIYFGLLCMLTIIFALIADLLLLPVVLRWYDHEAEGLGALKPALSAVTSRLAGLF